MNNKQSQYYVTATIRDNNRKIFISANDLKKAFEVEQELLKCQTLKILNIRHTKYKPRRKTNYIEIKAIEEIENSSVLLK